MSIKANEVKKLIKLIEETDVPITEIEVSDSESAIRISCGGGVSTVMQAAPIMQAPSPTATAASSANTQTSETQSTTADKTEPQGTPVPSPMVGTVYLAPSPETDKFVTVGKAVKSGDTVCLIEAMKMFNKIETEVSGTIIACLVEDGQPVEFDQPLFIIDTEK